MRVLTRRAHLSSTTAGLAAAFVATALGACRVTSASQPPAAVKSHPPECQADQLRVLFFGENGAAGTGNTSIGIANVS
jgi:hypothetical protein